MSSKQFSRQTTALVIVIVLAALTLGAVVSYGVSNKKSDKANHAIIVHVDGNGALTIAQAKRSECRATRSSALEAARWNILFGLASNKNATQADAVAAGEEGKRLPNLDLLTAKGGTVDGVHYVPCPQSIVPKKKPPSSTTTSGSSTSTTRRA